MWLSLNSHQKYVFSSWLLHNDNCHVTWLWSSDHSHAQQVLFMVRYLSLLGAGSGFAEVRGDDSGSLSKAAVWWQIVKVSTWKARFLQGWVILKIVFHGVSCCPVRAQMQQYRRTLMLKIAVSTSGVGDVELFSSSGTRNAVRLRPCTSTSIHNSSHWISHHLHLRMGSWYMIWSVAGKVWNVLNIDEKSRSGRNCCARSDLSNWTTSLRERWVAGSLYVSSVYSLAGE